MTTLSDTRAQIPDDDAEHARQHSLDQLSLVDTRSEERFDQIARMARRVFGVPIAAVTLLDHDRLWLKAAVGTDAQEAPRADTFCHRTVEQVQGGRQNPMVVSEDASLDPLFANLPMVVDGSVLFYAGYPLFGPGGHAVGAFCIFDAVPRTFDADQRVAFVEMAAWAQREIMRGDDMQRAAQVQRQLLPGTAPVVDGYEVDAVCEPAFQVGGDFYDMYPVPGGMMLTVADVMGKGTAAAIITASVRAVLRGISRTVASTGFGDLDLGRSMSLASTLLHDDLEPRIVSDVADKLWYPLWDAHIKLDHSVRTVPQALQVAAADLTASLGMLEARHIAGDVELSNLLIGGVRREWRNGIRGRFDELIEQTRGRWSRSGEIAHRAEDRKSVV